MSQKSHDTGRKAKNHKEFLKAADEIYSVEGATELQVVEGLEQKVALITVVLEGEQVLIAYESKSAGKLNNVIGGKGNSANKSGKGE